jgi:hypothetical protein
MQLSDVTSLGRPIDLGYPTNRAIAILSPAVMLVATGIRLVQGMAWLDSARWGLGAGLAVFFAWALSRELDPDYDLSAFVGAGLMLASLLLFDLPHLLVLFWLFAAARLVNRTTGRSAKALDSVGLLGLSSWLVWQGQWVAGAMTVVAFALDAWLAPPLRRHGIFAALALAATVVLSIFHGDLRMENGPSLPVIVAVVVMGGLFVAIIVTYRSVRSVGDTDGQRLNARRVQAAQLVALVTALAWAWWQGSAGVVALLPLWAAMLGAALYRGVATAVWLYRAGE